MVDYANMTTVDLDKLIVDAGLERAKREEPQPEAPPEILFATLQPAWNAMAENGSMIFSFQHRGFGWVTFVLEKQRVAEISTYMLRVLMTGALDVKAGETSIADAPASAPAGSTKH